MPSISLAVRNVGTGIAVLHGWYLLPAIQLGPDMKPTPLRDLTPLVRDFFIAPGDVAFGRARCATPRHRPTPRREPRSRRGDG
jgi:hypothetical protein